VFTYVAQRTKPAFVDKRGRKHPARLAGERYPLTPTALRRPFAHAKEEAGVENFRIHDLRHTFASTLVNNGVSLYEVQKLLGHAHIRTTERYAHLKQERLQESASFAGRTFEHILNTADPIIVPGGAQALRLAE
jgi:site-specific recombinase XerD